MGSCVRKTQSTSPSSIRNAKTKPTIIASTDDSERREMLEKLREEAIKNEELQKKKREEAGKILTASNIPLISYTKTTLNDTTKKQILDLFEKNDFVLIHELFQESKIETYEELGPLGYLWSTVHYACFNKNKIILEYLLRKAYHNFPKEYEKIVNSQTFEGYTPLIIITMEGELDLAETLLKFGGIDIEIKDKKGHTAYMTSLSYKKKEISVFLSSKKDFKTLNQKELSSLSESKFFDIWKSSLLEKDLASASHLLHGPSNEATMKTILSPQSSDIYKLTSNCMKSGENYIDNTFPHSLKDYVSPADKERYSRWVLARWLRPHELFNSSYSDIHLFETIDPKSIKQGTLDTCQFLAVLSTLAGFPERVKKIFQQTEINKFGVYALNFYLNGKPKEIIIDDYFPCYSDKLEPLFAKPDCKQIWVLLLEKAWCKLFGSYTIVEVEELHNAMEDILGAPSICIWTKIYEQDELFEKLINWFNNGNILAATACDNVDMKEGLVPTHTYSILGIYEYNEEKLIKLRNPWGYCEWQGLYADKKENWTPELQNAIKHVPDENDGLFIMTLNEFYYRFIQISVCFYFNDWNYQWLEVPSGKSTYFMIKIDKEQELGIRVHQENEKLYNVAKKPYHYSPVELMLFTEENILYNGADSKYFGKKSISLNNDGLVKLPVGKYYIRTKVHYEEKTPTNNYLLSVYSENKLPIEIIDYNIGKEKFYCSLTNIGRKFTKSTFFQDQHCELKFEWVDHLGVIYLKNDITDEWKVTIKIEKPVNILYTNELKLNLKPNSDGVILVKKQVLYEDAKFEKHVYETRY